MQTSPDKLDFAWIIEAKRRAADLQTGRVTPAPAADVFARVRASL